MPPQAQAANPVDTALEPPNIQGNPVDDALGDDTSQTSQAAPFNVNDPESIRQYSAKFGSTPLEQGQNAAKNAVSGLLNQPAISAHAGGAGIGATIAPAILTAISPEAGLVARLAAASAGAFAGSATGQAVANPSAGVDPIQAGKDAAVMGALPELLGAGAQRTVEAAGGLTKDLVNRMMGVGRKEVMFGKDPARAVIKRIPIASDALDLLDKVENEMDTVANEIEQAVLPHRGTIDVKDAVQKPLDKARNTILNSTLTPEAKQIGINEVNGFEESVLNRHVLAQGKVTNVGNRFASSLDMLSSRDTLELKRLIGNNVNWQSSAFPNEIKKLQTSIYSNIRQELENAIPEVKDINQDYADLAGAKQALTRKVAQQATGKGGVGVRDIAAGGLGEMVGGNMGAAAAVAAKRTAESTPGSTAMAKVVKTLADSDFKHLIPAITRMILGETPGPDGTPDPNQNAK